MWCVAFGLICTAMGSAWYHRNPTDSTLFWDRLPMTLVFAGVLRTAIAQRAGNDVGRRAIAFLVRGGQSPASSTGSPPPISRCTSRFSSGALADPAAVLASTNNDDDSVRWAWVRRMVSAGEAAEFADHADMECDPGLIAGHTPKHLLAAAAGAAVLWPLRVRR